MKTDHQSLQAAANWFAIINSEQASATDLQDLQIWLDQKPEHQHAWGYVKQVSDQFIDVQAEGQSHSAGVILNNSALSRRKLLKKTATFGGFIGCSLLGWQLSSHSSAWQRFNADYASAAGEIKTLRLPDQSQLVLNSNSALNQHFSAQERRLSLTRGEIWIETSSETRRPFIVNTEHGALRPLGTAFSVKTSGNSSHLAVYEGAVEITTLSGERKVIQSGYQAEFNQSQINPERDAINSQVAWRKGLLVASQMPLKEWLDRFNPFIPGYVNLDPAVEELEVLGVFPLQEPQKALHMLADVLPIKIEQPLPWWTNIVAKKKNEK